MRQTKRWRSSESLMMEERHKDRSEKLNNYNLKEMNVSK